MNFSRLGTGGYRTIAPLCVSSNISQLTFSVSVGICYFCLPSIPLRFGWSTPFPSFEKSPLILSCGPEKMVNDDTLTPC